MKRPRGRPSNFDHDEALEKALYVFWTRGYEGASMSELTDALGINRPSIYAAFGNKEELFRKALGKYMAGPVAYVADAMQQPTARQSIEMFLTKSAEALTSPSTPRGCMMVQGALSCGQGAELIQQELVTHRQNYEATIKKRLELAKTQSELAQNVDSGALAKYIVTVHQGMSVQATSGASKEELLAIVELALQNWPKS
ncbi:MAG TPA: TetR/AcrR family transcriptional regulator [Methylophilaceae bacterium]